MFSNERCGLFVLDTDNNAWSTIFIEIIGKGHGPSFKQTLSILFICTGKFVSRIFEIGSVVLKERFLKSLQCILFFCYYLPLKRVLAFNISNQLSSKSSREDMCRLPSFLLNIQSCVKQEVDMPQIQKCVIRYSSPYWCSVLNIRKLASVVPEKHVTEIILGANLSMSTISKAA